MKLTVDELTEVIRGAIKQFSEAGKKGVDGYLAEDDPVQPRGFGKAEAHQFDKPLEKKNLYKRQGNSNMGPFTAEAAIRAIARDVVKESFETSKIPNKHAKSSAPFAGMARVGSEGSVGNVVMPEWRGKKSATVWEDLGRWYDVGPKKKKSKAKKAHESNILQGVYEGRVQAKKDEGGERFKKLQKKLSGKKGVKDSAGLAASIGRKKYGKAKFQKMAASGKKGR
jgi:hypothetical protein